MMLQYDFHPYPVESLEQLENCNLLIDPDGKIYKLFDYASDFLLSEHDWANAFIKTYYPNQKKFWTDPMQFLINQKGFVLIEHDRNSKFEPFYLKPALSDCHNLKQLNVLKQVIQLFSYDFTPVSINQVAGYNVFVSPTGQIYKVGKMTNVVRFHFQWAANYLKKNYPEEPKLLENPVYSLIEQKGFILFAYDPKQNFVSLLPRIDQISNALQQATVTELFKINQLDLNLRPKKRR